MEEEEVDIVGDFEIQQSDRLEIEDADLPSRSVQLQPEFTQHPWVLDQGWSLHHCADEKSRLAIEKMLQEEQLYLDGKSAPASSSYKSHGSKEGAKPRPPQSACAVPKRIPWTEKEKTIFFEALEKFGRRWTKIKELLPNRSHQQVKHFGLMHFKRKDNIEETASPEARAKTFNSHILNQRSQRLPGAAHPKDNSHTSSELRLMRPSVGKLSSRKTSANVDLAEVVRIKRVSDSDSDDVDIDVDVDDEIDGDTVDINPVSCGQGSRVDINPVSCGQGSRVDINPVSCGQGSRVDINPVSCGQGSRVDINPVSCGQGSKVDINPVSCGQGSRVDRNIMLSVKASGGEPSRVSHVHHPDPLPAVSLPATAEHEPIAVVDMVDILSCSRSHVSESKLSCDKTCVSPDTVEYPGEPTADMAGRAEPYGDRGDTADMYRGPKRPSDTKLAFTDITCGGDSCIGGSGTGKGPPFSGGEGQAGYDPMLTSVERLLDPGSPTRDREDQESLTDENADAGLDLDSRNAEFAILSSNGDVIFLPNPSEEVILKHSEISDEERRIHAEFFDGKPGVKSPERYLKIRNFIIDAWQKNKPEYMMKTSARHGLRNCGDVNCIGRIHAYLEQTGAINFGCAQAQYNNPSKHQVPKRHKKKLYIDQKAAVEAERKESMRARRRRVRDQAGQWVDEKELEGKTIEHGQLEVKYPKPVRVKVARGALDRYDPFMLVPCLKFDDNHKAPFTLSLESKSLVVMDMHAHLSKAEVIGLLGGTYCKDTAAMKVTMAEPCDSLSTGMQCDMDPVSQTQACERIMETGNQVVGWYHSHPMFEANPSVRDMETQQEFQGWFAKGGSAFVGIIVSPYNRGVTSLRSDVTCLIVDSDGSANTSTRGTPYKFAYRVTHGQWDPALVLATAQTLADKYSHYHSQVDLLHHYKSLSNVTCLQKMLESLRQFWPSDTSFGDGHDEISLMEQIERLFKDSCCKDMISCETSAD